ncbi:probable RNA-binding protein 18 [Neocloeon triangulifer]|uniref:probable RNA-binding protein 18 n=1 Tax=Neocloeon triangulifer TaxID=2078957 RepID=UPI00286F8B1C|nr:probable RNA-binding protein 18 [Neocloeon triangulifer]
MSYYKEELNNAPPLPLEPLPKGGEDDRRLWIGNLDSRVTEFTLLKLLQSHGAIDKFDLLFHRIGPLAGQPRGYAFVTYKTASSASNAMKNLHGKRIGTKNINVRLATSVPKEDLERQKPEINIPALAGAKKSGLTNASSMTKIQEIEAQLQRMQNSSDDFNLTATASVANAAPAGPLVVPGMVLYKQQPQHREKTAPYSKNDRRHHRHRR